MTLWVWPGALLECLQSRSPTEKNRVPNLNCSVECSVSYLVCEETVFETPICARFRGLVKCIWISCLKSWIYVKATLPGFQITENNWTGSDDSLLLQQCFLKMCPALNTLMINSFFKHLTVDSLQVNWRDFGSYQGNCLWVVCWSRSNFLCGSDYRSQWVKCLCQQSFTPHYCLFSKVPTLLFRCLLHAVSVNHLTVMEVSGLGVHPDFKGRE